MLNKSFAVITSKKIRSFKKVIQVDSDKSISIRSFLIGAISHNISQIKNVLESEDVYSTIKCLKKLGVNGPLYVAFIGSLNILIPSSESTLRRNSACF